MLFRSGSHGDNVTLYPDIVREAARIARPGARYCVLTGEMRLMTDLMEASPHWTLAQLIRLRLAGIVPGLFVLVRR